MDFELKPEHQMVRKTIAEFVDREIVPRAQEIDESGEFPQDLFKKLGKTGFFGVRYPKEYGGSAADTLTFFLMCEEVARGLMTLAAGASMQALMGTDFVFRYGNEEIRQRLMVPAIRGEKIGVIAFTEPEAGSDLTNIKTMARKEGDEWVLNGTKTWISNAYIADFFTIVAMTGKGKGTEKVNFFLVERDTPGFTVSGKIDKLGVRGLQSTDLVLEDVRLPAENLLGEEGRGMANLFKILAEIRAMTGALSVGLLRAAYDASKRYASERVCFGRPINRYQAIQFKLARMATDLEAARLLVYRAAWLIDKGINCNTEASMAKWFASEAAMNAAHEAVRIHASYGFAMDYSVQRFYRDAPFLLFGGGTSEILQGLIARGLNKMAKW
jgi:alkylation response protein AidB-like acyl-CoA dehydrogenase